MESKDDSQMQSKAAGDASLAKDESAAKEPVPRAKTAEAKDAASAKGEAKVSASGEGAMEGDRSGSEDRTPRADGEAVAASGGPGIRPGAQPGARPGTQSGARPGAQPGAVRPVVSQPHSHVKVDMPAKNSRAKKGIIAAVTALVVVVAVGAFAFLGGQAPQQDAPAEGMTVTDIRYNDSGEVVNPVDWNEWINRNPDVYAWITIPDTEVDYPIVQHAFVDNYYLTHNIDGQNLIDGVPYTQKSYNSKDLTADPVTVVYGHTFNNEDTMFSTLHNFEDQAFFDSHPTFVAYTPTQRLEYEVVSAFEYDDRHILETQDMSDPEVAEEFFAMVQDPESQKAMVRQLDDALDSESDHLLVLSTCTKPANDSKRFLVVAVLRDVCDTEEKEVDMSSSIIESEVIFDPNADTQSEEGQSEAA